MVVVSGATAQLAEKVHPGVLISGGLLLVAVGMALLTLAQADSSWTVLLPGIDVALIGTGLFNPSVSAVALGSVPAEQSGLAAGVNDTFRQAGIAVGVAALGALIPAGTCSSGGSAVEYVDGLHTALLAGAAPRRGRRDRRRAADPAPSGGSRPRPRKRRKAGCRRSAVRGRPRSRRRAGPLRTQASSPGESPWAIRVCVRPPA